MKIMRSTRNVAILGIASIFVTSTAGATLLDLTTIGNSGTINGAIYEQINPQSTGTGVINSFVQIAPTGSTPFSGAYNTTVAMTLDNGNSDQFNHAIMLGDIPLVTVGGLQYREFILDVNEADQGPSANRFVSLDEVQIFVGGTANASIETFSAGILDHDGTLVYQMDAGEDSWVALDFQLNAGSGSGDMFLYVLETEFAGFDLGDTVVLYSEFGQQGVLDGGNPYGLEAGDYGQFDGFEEWALRDPTPTAPIPEPATVSILGLGLIGMALRRRARS